MSTELILKNHENLSVSLVAGAVEEKAKLLESAGWLEVVDSDASQEQGIRIQKDLKDMLKTVETSRKEIKAPLLAVTKTIDTLAKTFCKELEEEHSRIQREVSKWQEKKLEEQRAKEREAQAEKQRLLEEAAKKGEEARIAELARQVALPVVKQEKIEGTRIVERWTFRVTDIHAFYKAHPALVNLEPKTAEINFMLCNEFNVGKIPGIEIYKETKLQTR